MNILYITQDIPALDAGSLRHYHMLQRLGKAHDITLLSLVFRSDLAAGRLEAIKPYIKALSLVPVEQVKRKEGALPALKRKVRVKIAERRSVQRLRALVRAASENENIDVVFLTSKLALGSVADVSHLPIVVDCCDAASLRARDAMRDAPPARRVRLGLKWLRRRHVERRVATFAPDVIFASARDQKVVIDGDQESHVVPNGIDLGYWTRRTGLPLQETIVFFGALDYEPNHDAAVWLVKEIFPIVRREVPGASLEIVGRDPRQELLELAGRCDGVTAIGRVDDIRPYIERAAVACIPLRIASGIQNKVLEAMAMETPVVTTAPAAEGLRLTGGDDPPLIVGGSASELAESIVRLLRDPASRERTAQEGRRFVADNFDWAASAAQLERMLYRAAGRSA